MKPMTPLVEENTTGLWLRCGPCDRKATFGFVGDNVWRLYTRSGNEWSESGTAKSRDEAREWAKDLRRFDVQWSIFDGHDYEKVHYDVLTEHGTVRHCWPNGGRMYATDGTGKYFDPGCWVSKSTTHPLDEIMAKRRPDNNRK